MFVLGSGISYMYNNRSCGMFGLCTFGSPYSLGGREYVDFNIIWFY